MILYGLFRIVRVMLHNGWSPRIYYLSGPLSPILIIIIVDLEAGWLSPNGLIFRTQQGAQGSINRELPSYHPGGLSYPQSFFVLHLSTLQHSRWLLPSFLVPLGLASPPASASTVHLKLSLQLGRRSTSLAASYSHVNQLTTE